MNRTKSSIRSIVLPPAVLEVLRLHLENAINRWLFPSPVKDGATLDPAAVRKRLELIFDHAQCKRVRFHDLRHTFATNALAGGMDVKTLSTIIGHVSTATTLDIYTHSTEEMQHEAAQRIDVGLGNPVTEQPTIVAKTSPATEFQPYKGKIRKSGTGCVSQINDHLWEGRYSPKWIDGKRKICTTYTKTEEECEEQLAALITETKAELAKLRNAKPA